MIADATLDDMANHPNRSRRETSAGRSPTPDEVRQARERAGLTQEEAATKIRVTLRGWQYYEGPIGTIEHRHMLPGLFELFLIKTGQPIPSWMNES